MCRVCSRATAAWDYLGPQISTRIRELVWMAHAFGGNWIKTMNTGGYMSAGNDPAKVTWFEDEMQALGHFELKIRSSPLVDFCQLRDFDPFKISCEITSYSSSGGRPRLESCCTI